MYLCVCNAITEKQFIEIVENRMMLPTGNACCGLHVNKILKNLGFESISHYNTILNYNNNEK